MALGNIRFVLVRTTHPGNVGAAARALKTMCLDALTLVAPERYPHPNATDMAVGADDVLARARVCATLDAAIGDCVCVVGTSARDRRIAWPSLAPHECAPRLLADAANGPVAILFGQERTGLTNEELDRCQYVVSIAANPAYASLNLASAVQILAYELYGASLARAGATPAPGDGGAPVNASDMQRLLEHLEQVLIEIDFLDPANPRLLMRRLTRLFNRATLDTNEYNIVRGVLTAVQRALAGKS
jgi:TrmH family RNA methyltransferase